MKKEIIDASNQFSKSGRVKINGWEEYTSSTGERVQGDSKFIEMYKNICEESDKKKEKWIQWLRSFGIKAAHPNDGHHDRENCEFHLAYPYFDDGINEGDSVALGDFDNFVVIKVLETKKRFFCGKYYRYHEHAYK